MNAMLRMPFVKQRIEKFLTETKMSEEFSHTVLHRVPRPLPPAGGVARKPSGPSVVSAKEQPKGMCPQYMYSYVVGAGQFRTHIHTVLTCVSNSVIVYVAGCSLTLCKMILVFLYSQYAVKYPH